MQPQVQLLSSLEEGHGLLQRSTDRGPNLRTPQRCLAGQRWQWDGVDFEVLHPQASDYDRAAAGQLKPNGLSCVLRVSTPQTTPQASALLTGDIERAQEQALLDSQPSEKLKTDWLLVPHHGSKTSSTEAWLAATAPRWAVVQSGYRNRFGHPAPNVMQRYDAAGIQWVDSARCGAASWASDAPDTLQCERHRLRRYWQHRVP
jgi:competence protein ComEC